MSSAILETVALTKHYGRFEAVRELSLAVPAGSISGFLGQNGAGKSSTIKMLLGMMRPTGGSGRIFGLNIEEPSESIEIRQRAAFVSEDKRLYDYMTVEQMIRFTRSFFPGWRGELEQRLLREFELPLDRKIKKLSKGMRTQTALLLAFCRGAELLILDEPTEGLDPVNIEKVLELLVGFAAEGTTVFFSSHQIAEVEQIADRVFIIDKGRLLLDAPLDEMKEEYRRINMVFDTPLQTPAFALEGIERVRVDGRSVSIFASHNIEGILNHAHALHATSVDVLPVSLKEIFLESLKAR
ncbi:MAG TPA: ABC transporter ATP-binding protein [Pyrinomonadaceae bacterium]|jgi:ABC-2 type transport system ATP-binding protein|nr:ABC transporter ATP-binding protein [Pyrinomonadaceae bacterium]